MNPINSRGLVFALNTTAAALLALYISFSFGLTNPWWAALTVFITSQPFVASSGAVVARALYRIAGTVAGVMAAMVILPTLANEPALLIVTIAAWVGTCLYVSLLDRTPRGYAFMLAGYTVALVGLPQIGDPSNLFDTALARGEEITIGAVCAATLHCLVFPRSIHAAVRAKVDASLKDARGWIASALSTVASPAGERAARRKIAADLTELNTLGVFIRHEVGRHGAIPRAVSALEQRMTALLPLVAAVEDRLQALAKDAAIGEALSQHLASVRQWIQDGVAGDQHRVDLLIEAGQRLADDAAGSPPWQEMLTASLLQRLDELVRAWSDSLLLIDVLRNPEQAPNERANALIAETSARDLHVDHGLAAYAGFAAAVAVLVAGSIAVATEWSQGTIAVGIAATTSSVFAFIDDPRPMQRTFLVWSFVSIPVAALYRYAILPVADGYVLLALSLLPLFFGTALYLTSPRYGLPALAFALVSHTLIAVQPAQSADFTTFTHVSIAGLVGTIIALVVTSLIRVIGAETSSWRILRAGWRDLAALANGAAGTTMTTAAWVGQMLDRVAMLVPRLARVAGVERFRDVDALGDMRLGVNVLEMRELARGPAASASASIEHVLRGVGEHFESQRRDRHLAPDTTLLRSIDTAIGQLLRLDMHEARRRALVAATGLRRGLFPDAPPYRPERPEEAST